MIPTVEPDYYLLSEQSLEWADGDLRGSEASILDSLKAIVVVDPELATAVGQLAWVNEYIDRFEAIGLE